MDLFQIRYSGRVDSIRGHVAVAVAMFVANMLLWLAVAIIVSWGAHVGWNLA